MFMEGIAGLPNDKAAVEEFEAQVETAKRAGVDVLRVVIIPGRRYERFETEEEFRTFAARGLRSLELAEPVAARRRVRLAVENHKDQRIPERLAFLKKIDSEYVGMCLDMGNSFALLEDPVKVVEAFAPWAFTVHIKDQAVKEYEDGFLFADMALGEGFLDLPKMVRIVRAVRPETRYSLETITRDPLEVPCLTEKYWATFPDVPGADLARTLRTVRAHEYRGPLPKISGLPMEEQVKREERNVRRSLAYARESLGI
jgi:sugar phosphate isomerase/epimerase